MSEQSEQSTEITTVEKTEKVKDPRKVELGKRLAKISREAKERKARERQLEAARVEKEVKSDHEVDNQREISDYIDFRYFIRGVGLVASLGGLYYSYKRDKRKIREENSRSDKLEHSEKEKVNNVKKNQKKTAELINLKIHLKNVMFKVLKILINIRQ